MSIFYRPRRRYPFWAVLKIQYSTVQPDFFIRQQYCAATKIQWQIASRAQNGLQIIWISIEAHATLHWIPIWRP